MKLGTFALLLVAILIAFGFLIREDLLLRDKLKEIAAENQDLKRIIEEKDGQLQACQADNLGDHQRLAERDAQIEALLSIMRSDLISTASDIGPKAVAAVFVAAQLIVGLFQAKRKKGKYARLSPEELGLIIALRRSKRG